MAKMTLEQAAQALGVFVNATPEQVKKAYRKLVNQYHPDRNQNNAHADEMMRKINYAFEVFEKHFEQQQANQNTTNQPNTSTGNGTGRQQSNSGNSNNTHRPNGNTTNSNINDDPIIKTYWQSYQRARQEHENFLKTELAESRQKIAELESKLQKLFGKNSDEELKYAEDLAHKLRLHKMLVGRAVLLANFKDDCLKRYNDAVARYNNRTKGGR